MTYGWQSNVGTDEEKQNKKFISKFSLIFMKIQSGDEIR